MSMTTNASCRVCGKPAEQVNHAGQSVCASHLKCPRTVSSSHTGELAKRYWRMVRMRDDPGLSKQQLEVLASEEHALRNVQYGSRPRRLRDYATGWQIAADGRMTKFR